MKKKHFRVIKVFVFFACLLFCFENVLFAQTARRKSAVKRPTSAETDNRKAKKSVGVNAADAEGAKTAVNPKLLPDAEVAVLETDYGRIIIELYSKIAPQMVERFKKLIREGFYDGTAFHRTSPSLGIIQGGDPNSKDADPANDGYGKSSYPDVPAEFTDIPYERGIVGAARANDPNSANCQFFIMLKRQPFFDKKYTIFGRVVEGLGNAYIINISPTKPSTERPEDPITIRKATMQLRKKVVAIN